MSKSPLVLCLTNTVAANMTANCLLAIGAKPAMVEEPCEAEELAEKADALVVNLGTVTSTQAEAMRKAIDVATSRSIPWVLDPVGVQLLAFRRRLAQEFISRHPSLIRCNQAEAAFLGETGCTTLVTGAVDEIIVPDAPSRSERRQEIPGGTPLLQAITATGCAQGGLCAAFLGRGQTPADAALSASKLMKRAGELALERTREPGSLQVALIDALWKLSHD